MEVKNKGITLISLVITVIVLLILAAVTINLTLGHNGIFSRAKEAKETYEKESLLEEMRLAMLDKKLEKGLDLTNDDIEDALEKFGEVQQDDAGNITGVKPNGGGDDLITYDEIENGETPSGGTGSGTSSETGSGASSAEVAALMKEVNDLKSEVEELNKLASSRMDMLENKIPTIHKVDVTVSYVTSKDMIETGCKFTVPKDCFYCLKFGSSWNNASVTKTELWETSGNWTRIQDGVGGPVENGGIVMGTNLCGREIYVKAQCDETQSAARKD